MERGDEVLDTRTEQVGVVIEETGDDGSNQRYILVRFQNSREVWVPERYIKKI